MKTSLKIKAFVKENKGKLALSSLLILLPMVLGFFPAPGLGSPWQAGRGPSLFFVMPPCMLALHWICLLLSAADPLNGGQNQKALRLYFWILPFVCMAVSGSLLLFQDGKGSPDQMTMLTGLVLGLLFLMIGNYMPKIQRNSTMGIKIKWTLVSTENWNQTHRFAGRLWAGLGLCLMGAAFLPETVFFWVLGAGIAAAAIAPILYSAAYAKKHPGQQEEASLSAAPSKKAKLWSLVLLVLLLSAVAVLLLTGSIRYEFSEAALSVKASYFTDLFIPYGEIDSVSYAENLPHGSRIAGFGSFRLHLGSYRSPSLGPCTLYGYAGAKGGVILKKGDSILILTGENEGETKALYEAISERVQAPSKP